MASTAITLPKELLNRIDKDRFSEGAESGDAPNRSEWIRDAARQKLGGEEVEKGVA